MPFKQQQRAAAAPTVMYRFSGRRFMPKFDSRAYSRTCDLFNAARNARVSLPSLKEQLIFDAERVIESMEDFGEGDGGDAAYLRYYYLMGMTQAKAAEKAGYSYNYRKEKATIALVHASFAVERMGL